MLDADARKLLDLINSKHVPPYEAMPPVAARAFFKAGAFTSQPPPPQLALVDNLLAEGPAGTIPVRHYRPLQAQPGALLPALVFFHGGGFTLGDIDTHDVLCRQLCDQAGIAVVSVDYRLGPEHKFPAAHVDCFAALQWVVAHAARLCIDPGRIAVGGDSAGGNIAAACTLMARDLGAPALAFQLLIYPATDFRCIAPSHKRNGEGYLLTSSLIDYFCACYLNSPSDRLDCRLSPSLAASHANLPPALILTAGYDPLVDEGREYSERLQSAGVPAEHVCYEGQLHGFITMGRFISQANDAVTLCAERLRMLHDDEGRLPVSHAA